VVKKRKKNSRRPAEQKRESSDTRKNGRARGKTGVNQKKEGKQPSYLAVKPQKKPLIKRRGEEKPDAKTEMTINRNLINRQSGKKRRRSTP